MLLPSCISSNPLLMSGSGMVCVIIGSISILPSMYQSTIFGTSVRPRAPPKAVRLAEPECLLNLSPDLYACVESELFGSLGQPCDASCPWKWRAQRVRVGYPLGDHSIAR